MCCKVVNFSNQLGFHIGMRIIVEMC
jgi:hypothetical protein